MPDWDDIMVIWREPGLYRAEAPDGTVAWSTESGQAARERLIYMLGFQARGGVAPQAPAPQGEERRAATPQPESAAPDPINKEGE